MRCLPVGSAVAAPAVAVYGATGDESATSAAAAGSRQAFVPDIVISPTIPPKGDLNPYGVAIVPAGFPTNVDAAQGGDFAVAVAEVGPGTVHLVWIDDNANDVTVLDRGAVPRN